MIEMESFIRNMPKAELHVHIEGTLEPEQRLAFARRNGIAVPHENASALAGSYSFHDLSSFLALYYDGLEVLVREQDFFELTYAYLERMHSHNVIYTEMHFDPQAHTVRGVSFDTVIQGIRRAQVQARNKFGVRSHLILGINRDKSVASGLEALDQALPYKQWIVGLGLDSEEQGNPPVKFREVYERARAEGYRLTAHCDVDQHHSVEHIWQCLEVLGVERIDHGVNVLDDPGLEEEIRRRQMCLTVCPTSTPDYPIPRRAAQLEELLARGIRVTANTDDPAYMLSYYMSDILTNTQKAVSFSKDQMVALTRNAFESAWIEPEEKEAYLDTLGAYVSQNPM